MQSELNEYRLEVEAGLKAMFDLAIAPRNDEIDAIVRKGYGNGSYAAETAVNVSECQSFHDAIDSIPLSFPELDQFRFEVLSILSRMYGHPLNIWDAYLESTLSELYHDCVSAGDAARELDGCITGAED